MREISRRVATEAVRTKLDSLSDAQLGLVLDIVLETPVFNTRVVGRSGKDDAQLQNTVDSDWDS